MMTCTKEGDSIECAKSLLTARDILKSSRVNKAEIGICLKFKCKINCCATIIEELTPKIFRYRRTSLLDLNDCLVADIIELFYVGDMSVGLISNFTSKHGIQEASLKGYIFAHIVIPFRWVLEKRLHQ